MEFLTFEDILSSDAPLFVIVNEGTAGGYALLVRIVALLSLSINDRFFGFVCVATLSATTEF
jgi:hypothetical protein